MNSEQRQQILEKVQRVQLALDQRIQRQEEHLAQLMLEDLKQWLEKIVPREEGMSIPYIWQFQQALLKQLHLILENLEQWMHTRELQPTSATESHEEVMEQTLKMLEKLGMSFFKQFQTEVASTSAATSAASATPPNTSSGLPPSN